MPTRAGAQQHNAFVNDNEPALLDRCKLRWFNQTLDHFSFAKPEAGPGWFMLRFYVCDEHWRRPTPSSGSTQAPQHAVTARQLSPGSQHIGEASVSSQPPGPIFFYVGNEADVTLYLNHSGLMWENAADFGALLVFAEHRYYGKSKPFRRNLRKHMGYLTSEQALADYAVLLTSLKEELGAEDSPVIGFGGSYGGMLGSWMRLKYPHILDGVVAASAPIWNFLGLNPPGDTGYFAQGVTYDASTDGGSPAGCVPNVKRGWQVLKSKAKTRAGRRQINAAMRLCPSSALNRTIDAGGLADWLASSWDYMAMGDFPMPSSYMLNGQGMLPPFPVRAACGFLAEPIEGDVQLLSALASAAGVFYNYSGTLDCFDFGHGLNPESDEDSNFWGYQWCTEMYMPGTRDGENDMFWPQPFNSTEQELGCLKQWGVTPRMHWAVAEFGGRRLEAASNIVFSNGLLDPWHGGGVLQSISDTVVAVIIPDGAHHLDLMFSDAEYDPPSVKRARAIELQHVRRWVKEAYARKRPAVAASR